MVTEFRYASGSDEWNFFRGLLVWNCFGFWFCLAKFDRLYITQLFWLGISTASIVHQVQWGEFYDESALASYA